MKSTHTCCLLAVDIGNTNITIGLFDIDKKRSACNPLKIWRLSTLEVRTADEYAITLINMLFYFGVDINKIKDVAIASVVPSLNVVFEELAKKYFGTNPCFINYKNSGGLVFAVKNPEEVGADRIANVVAAYRAYSCSCLVIDFGTATTFDCVNSKGEYVGGAIAPGSTMSAQALSLKTAQLPYVKMEKPMKSIGTTTIESMQSGLYFGYIGLVNELITRIKKEMEVKRIIATGGLVEPISNEIKEIEFVLPNLTLEGILAIWQKIKS
ncbi:MAG: type III pantothenate kinase [Endomicrobium sp.]|jgi:type III pantothenate kinase|nr:type III pantothenate kinase [Endomicrobium sp.]